MSAENEFFCSDLAWKHGIPLVGTATRGDVWFLLEYRGSWGAEAFKGSTVPEEVKRRLLSFDRPDRQVRTLLIRQDARKSKDGITFFIALPSALSPQLFQYQLDDYRDILNLDIPAILSGEPGDPAHLREKPLYLVCTNGRRDKCCALYGPGVVQALQEEAGDAVWHSSHIGGHNQAPIMLFFPHGVNYGRATPSEARRLVREYQENRLVLKHYRGRVCYQNHLQAAEHFWREQTGVLDLPGMRVESSSQLGDDQWAVVVSNIEGDRAERVQVVRRRSDFSIPITCTKKKESQIISFHRLE